jgi:protein involved in polysaccharide export with SLBB domain
MRTSVLLSLLALIVAPTRLLGQSAAAEYHIRPGDTLRIVVLNRVEYGQEVFVRDDGRIDYFVLGSIDVGDMTLDALRGVLVEGLRGHLTEPDVLIVPVPREAFVYVGGQVAAPGKYGFMEPVIDVRKALALAGSALPLSADLSTVYVLRTGAPVETYDLTTAPGPHIEIRPGDVVYVAELCRIRVTGNVREPGVFHVRGSATAAYALSLAGGVVDDQGALARLSVLRADGSTGTAPVNADVVLRHGDALHVPNAYLVEEISVVGYVQKPGLYRVRGPVSVGRALALAGDAVREEANLSEVEIVRLDGAIERVDLRSGRSAAIVQPGETVRVNRRFQINWPMLFSAVSTAVLLTSLVRN